MILLLAIHAKTDEEELVENQIENNDRNDRDTGGGHDLIPHGAGILGLEALKAERQRVLCIGLHIEHGLGKLVPETHKAEDGRRCDGGPCQWHRDTEKDSVAAQSVDLSGFLHISGEIYEELAHQKNVRDIGGCGEDQRAEMVEHPKGLEQQIVWDQQDLTRDHHQEQEPVIDAVTAGEAQAGERIAGHGVNEDVDNGADRRHEEGVEEPAGE